MRQNSFDKNIAIITNEKSKVLFKTVMSNNKITMYIELPYKKYDTQSVMWQAEMRNKKVKLRYGTGLNISCIDNTYDFVAFDTTTLIENEYLKFESYFEELLRITKSNAILIFYGDNINYLYTNLLQICEKQKNKIIIENGYKNNDLNKFLKIVIRKQGKYYE